MGIGSSSPTAMDHVSKLGVNLTGKTALVTGCTSGMGIEIARALASAGCSVFITGRDSSRLSRVKEELDSFLRTRGAAGSVQVVHCDLASFASVRAAAAEFLSRSSRLHLLVCNAGIMGVPHSVTAEGADLQLSVNHLAHHLLFTLLQPAMLASAPARVVVVSSNAAFQWGPAHMDYSRLPAVSAAAYSPLLAYAQSKLANILFAQQIHVQLKAQGVTAYSLHPGVLRTGAAGQQPPLHRRHDAGCALPQVRGTGSRHCRLLRCGARHREAQRAVFR